MREASRQARGRDTVRGRITAGRGKEEREQVGGSRQASARNSERVRGKDLRRARGGEPVQGTESERVQWREGLTAGQCDAREVECGV